jgi:cytochrome c oxidase subunit II
VPQARRHCGIGPALAGIFGQEVRLTSGETVMRDEAYLRKSIVEPATQVVEGYQPIMPPYQGQLTEDQVLQLITYIKNLRRRTRGCPMSVTTVPPRGTT